jgi:hypothetical protein
MNKLLLTIFKKKRICLKDFYCIFFPKIAFVLYLCEHNIYKLNINHKLFRFKFSSKYISNHIWTKFRNSHRNYTLKE